MNYSDYCERCREAGGQPVTESEFWALVEEEKMEGLK